MQIHKKRESIVEIAKELNPITRGVSTTTAKHGQTTREMPGISPISDYVNGCKEDRSLAKTLILPKARNCNRCRVEHKT